MDWVQARKTLPGSTRMAARTPRTEANAHIKKVNTDPAANIQRGTSTQVTTERASPTIGSTARNPKAAPHTPQDSAWIRTTARTNPGEAPRAFKVAYSSR